MANQHPVRRCAPCDINWPAVSDYNLCQRCLRNTFASTDDLPNTTRARKEAARYQAVRDFDAKCDAEHAERQAAERAAWDAEMEALLPAGTQPSQWGLRA